MCCLDKRFYDIAYSLEKNIDNIKGAAIKNKKGIPVDNQFVAVIEITNEKVVYIEDFFDSNKRSKFKIKKYSNLPIIGIILESPHKSEYDKNKNPIGPLCNCNSIKILRENLLLNLYCINNIHNQYNNGVYIINNNIIDNGKYLIKLIEAIKYQCSLGNLKGSKNKERRNKIFKNCIHSCFKNDFLNEIKDVQILINCCTGQKDHKIHGLQKIVQKIINNSNCQHKILLYGYHPSSPWFCTGFKKVT